jgi:short-subunit dehydrogenase
MVGPTTPTAGTTPWRVCWITGASSGIGRDIARQLARQGVIVAISARSADKLAEVAAEHANLRAFPVDVTDQAAVADTVSRIERELGVIDLAILNAGVWHPMGAANYEVAKVIESTQVNYFGLVYGVGALLKPMLQRRGGHLALVSSVAGYRGLPMGAAYSPTKAAVISLAESLQPELSRANVTLSLINPGFVDTPMTRVNTFPMPFILTVEDAASRIITGLKAKRYEIAFPAPLVATLKLARIMPNWLFFWYARTVLSRPRKP